MAPRKNGRASRADYHCSGPQKKWKPCSLFHWRVPRAQRDGGKSIADPRSESAACAPAMLRSTDLPASGLRCNVAIQAASASRVCSVSSNWTARWVFVRVPEVSAHHRSLRSSRARCPSGSWTNYGTHKISSVKNWFARHPCFHVHFTPTSASWLNQVERWFATLAEKQIRRGTHRSTRELERHPRLPAQLQRRVLRLDQVG